jgi:hypothetical protein
MTDPLAQLAAAALQDRLRARLGHDAVSVRPYGKNLIVDLEDEGGREPVARLVGNGAGLYQPGFRNHRGTWEPLPGEGDLEHAAGLLADALGPFLGPL